MRLRWAGRLGFPLARPSPPSPPISLFHVLSLIPASFAPHILPPALQVGTMIEVPRGALRAGDLAAHAEFFSFGTNDLTQASPPSRPALSAGSNIAKLGEEQL